MATDYDKFLRDNNVESAVLLGSYDEQDNYFVDKPVKEELVKIKKLITLYKQDYLLCEAKVSDVVLKFIIRFFLDELEGEKYGSLYLLESYTNLNKQEELETFLASFKSSNDPVFLDKLKEVMNLFTPNEMGDGKQIETSELLEQIFRTKKDISKAMILNMGVDNRKYCNEILKILKNSKAYPNLEKLIKKKIKGIKVEKNTAKYFALLKEILDEVIFENYNELDEETLNWLKQVNQNYINTYSNIKKQIQKPVNKKVEEVSAPKKKVAKSKSAGGGGGGGDKPSKSKSSPTPNLQYDVEVKPFEMPVFDMYAKVDFDKNKKGPRPHLRRHQLHQQEEPHVETLNGDYFKNFVSFDNIIKKITKEAFDDLGNQNLFDDQKGKEIPKEIFDDLGKNKDEVINGKYSNSKDFDFSKPSEYDEFIK